MKLGLIGNGAIARMITEFCRQKSRRLTIVGAIGLPSDVAAPGQHPIVYSWPELAALDPDLVIECAGHQAVRSYAEAVLEAGKDLILASTGCLADPAIWNLVSAAAERSRGQVKLPAGALPGVDALCAARFGGLAKVSLRSSKPPRAWTGTPAESTHDLTAIIRPTVIFSGNAREAALTFPKNANVAATAALAGLGFEATMVSLVADPGITQNIHRLDAEGAFGRLALEINANPSPDNPKTSQMAALSIMRLLANETSAIVL